VNGLYTEPKPNGRASFVLLVLNVFADDLSFGMGLPGIRSDPDGSSLNL